MASLTTTTLTRSRNPGIFMLSVTANDDPPATPEDIKVFVLTDDDLAELEADIRAARNA